MMEPIDLAMSSTKRSRRRPNLTLALPKRHPSFSSSSSPSSSPTTTTTKTHQTFSLTLSDLHKERRIGSGVVGTVYKVRHRPTNKSYALKVISGNHDDSVRRSICREIEILQAVDHPNVVKCYGLFETAGEIQVLLEYMDCGSLLGAHIHHEPSLALFSRQILSGLAYLHNRKIVHRDIKPANLLINSRRQVKIADFGVSRILAETTGATNSLVGTVEYISPERIISDLNYGVYDGYAGDIWSFGVTLLEVYLGRFPFVVEKDGDWASLISAICLSAPPEVPETGSREFHHFIGCCLQRDPAKRWTAEQLLQDPFITHISLRYQANAQQDPTSWGTYVKSKLLQGPVSSSTTPNPELPISPEQSVRTTKPHSPKNIVISMTKAEDEATNQKDVTPNEEPTSSKDVMSGIAITDSFDRVPSHLKECLLYTSLFPRNYRFEKDTLIHLWTAAGYVQQEEEEELIEDTCGDYFDKLLSMNFFQESFPLNYPTRPRFYKLQDDARDLVQNCSPGEYARLDDDNVDDISGQARHLAVLGEKVDQLDFGSFNRMGELQSLLLLHEKKKCITQIPYDLFLNLKCLCVLDLSRTRLTELPSSVGSLGALRYLDLSETCIKWLPPSVTTLSNLQVLRLRDCYNFVELPKDTMDMINLRHLDLDVIRQLCFMPPKMGKLTNLQTLSAFIVGTDYGCQIEELKDLVNLRGSLILIKLEYVLTSKDAKEAMLSNKKYLRRLVMQWSSSCPAEEVLEALEPHIDLEELEVVCYGGLVFSPWLGDPSFSKLSSIYLYNCKDCFLLPPLGRLPSLKLLKVGEMHAVKEIDYRFCGGGGKGFPRLETLLFDGMPCLEKWTGVEEGEMPWLEELKIVDCPELVQLPNLSHLKYLQHLEINYCSKLRLLTEEDLSASLQRLVISGCPILEERCCKGGDDWQKISNITSIQIDYQHISKN